MPTLFDATLELARRITAVRESLATSTSTTVLTDALASWAVNYWQGGTIWIDNTVKSLSVVSNTATTVTYPTTTDPSETTKYSLAGKDYPRDVLRQSVNQALNDLRAGKTETIITSVAGQVAYTLTGISDVVRVDLEDAIVAGEFHPHQNWHEVEGELRFDTGYEILYSGLDIRVTTRKVFATLALDADAIPAGVDYELLIWKAATHALRWGLMQYGQDPQKHVAELLNEAQGEVSKRGGNRAHLKKQTIVGGW